MGSSILTSPDVRDKLKEKQEKREEAKRKKEERQRAKKEGTEKRKLREEPSPPMKKRARSKNNKRSMFSSSDSEDTDFCIICLKLMPTKLTKRNSIECNTCKRPVHLKCAKMTGGIAIQSNRFHITGLSFSSFSDFNGKKHKNVILKLKIETVEHLTSNWEFISKSSGHFPLHPTISHFTRNEKFF